MSQRPIRFMTSRRYALWAVINAPAPARALRRKIGWTENIRTAVQIRHDLLLAEHMVAERDHVRAGGKISSA